VSPMRWFWLVVVSLGIVVLQLTIADELSVAGVHPELVWVLPVAAGLSAGATAGMAAGFVGGAVADLFLPAPFGLTALVGVFVGYAAGRLGEEGIGDLGGAAWGVAPVLGAATGFVAPLLYALLAAIGGHRSYLSIDVLVVSGLDLVACALLIRPVMALVGRRLAGDGARTGPLEPVRGAL
jgi:rod shape-determining protein MreD